MVALLSKLYLATIAVVLLRILPRSTGFKVSGMCRNPSVLSASSLEAPSVMYGTPEDEIKKEDVAQILVVAPKNSLSPFHEKPFGDPVTWVELFHHVKERATWESQNRRFDASQGDLRLNIMTCEELLEHNLDAFMEKHRSPILVLAGVRSTEHSLLAKELVSKGFEAVSVVDTSTEVADLEKYGQYKASASHNSLLTAIDDNIGSFFKTKKYSNKSAGKLVKSLWERESVEDTLFAMLILINEFTSFL